MVIMDGDVHLTFDDGRYKQYQWRTEEDGKLKTAIKKVKNAPIEIDVSNINRYILFLFLFLFI